jgi:tetratricopeptide (TPR) repeat protein
MYYAWGHFQKAIEPLKKAIELEPEAVASHINLGMNYNHAGMYGDAEQVLRQALEIVPDQTQAHYDLGFALLQQQRTKEAIEHFRAAVKSNPQNVMAYHFLGYSLVVHEHDLFAAKKLLKELESLHPAQAKELERLISLNEPSDSKM